MLPNGQKRYKSLSGAIFTTIAFIVVSLYAVYKWQLLVEQNQSLIQTKTIQNFFADKDDKSFGQKDGF